jgi:hypothetical protein
MTASHHVTFFTFFILSLVMEEKEQKIELEKGGMQLSKLVQSCVPFSEWYKEKGM